MSANERKPLFFLVHGAWATSWVFTPLITHLWSHGYPTWAKDCPHSKGDPTTTIQDDINFIRSELFSLFEAGHDVIPVCWSFGGVVGPAAFDGLSKGERVHKGHSNGIIGIVFASAPILPRRDMTANDIGQYWDNQSWFRGKGASALVPGPLVSLADPTDFMCDLPNANHMYAHLIRPLSYGAHATPIHYDLAIKVNREDEEEGGSFPVPTAYLLSAKDEMIPATVQERVVKKYQGKFKVVWTLPAGHFWAISHSSAATKHLVEFARDLQGDAELLA